jgi:hypothetical protein
VQALLLALKKIGSVLHVSQKKEGKNILWFDMEDLGFPLPDILKE